MRKRDVFAKLRKAVIEGDADSCKLYAEEAIKLGIDAYQAIMMGCAEGMRTVGEKYERKEYFIPNLLLSADAMYVTMDVLRPHLSVEKLPESMLGKVVIGTIEGDIHDIGKNIVRTLLEAEGCKVFDLGKNVPSKMFVRKAKETNAEVIALSTLMTTTLPAIKEVIDMLEKEGIRERVKVIIGGASTSKRFAEEVGADAWAEDVIEGVRMIKRMLSMEGR